MTQNIVLALSTIVLGYCSLMVVAAPSIFIPAHGFDEKRELKPAIRSDVRDRFAEYISKNAAATRGDCKKTLDALVNTMTKVIETHDLTPNERNGILGAVMIEALQRRYNIRDCFQ